MGWEGSMCYTTSDIMPHNTPPLIVSSYASSALSSGVARKRGDHRNTHNLSVRADVVQDHITEWKRQQSLSRRRLYRPCSWLTQKHETQQRSDSEKISCNLPTTDRPDKWSFQTNETNHHHTTESTGKQTNANNSERRAHQKGMRRKITQRRKENKQADDNETKVISPRQQQIGKQKSNKPMLCSEGIR